MKKYISLFSFIALFFVGIQQSQAQDSNRVEAEMPEAIAKKQTHELHQMIELTGDQQIAVYKVLLDYEKNVEALKNNNDISAVQRAKTALLENVKGRLKSILTQPQMQAYIKSLEISKK